MGIDRPRVRLKAVGAGTGPRGRGGKLICMMTTAGKCGGWLALSLVLGACSTPERRAELSYYPYLHPLVSPGAQFVALPPAVRNVIRAENGSAGIVDIVKANNSGRILYVVHFENEEAFPPLFISPEGGVLHPDLTVAVPAPREPGSYLPGSPITGLKPADLPPAVLRVWHERAPSAEIAYINRESWGDRFIYILTFRDETHNPKLYVTTDGTVLNQGPQ